MRKDETPRSIHLTADQEERIHTALDILVRYLLRSVHFDHKQTTDTGSNCVQAEALLEPDKDTGDHTHLHI